MYAAIPFLAAVAGIIQTVTGFGSGIFMMIFFPMYLPVINASALSASITLACTLQLTWSYRASIHTKLLIFPALCYALMCTTAIIFGSKMDSKILLRIFGVFLIVLSLYFLFASKRITMRANLVTAAFCSILSGIAGGLFGIGGPPMVLYYLAALPEKEDYFGTIEAFFFVTGLIAFCVRGASGVYTLDLIPLTLLGIVGIAIGSAIGRLIVRRINADLMRKIIYIFLCLSGIINLLG